MALLNVLHAVMLGLFYSFCSLAPCDLAIFCGVLFLYSGSKFMRPQTVILFPTHSCHASSRSKLAIHVALRLLPKYLSTCIVVCLILLPCRLLRFIILCITVPPR